jgi:hypothetical protein
LSNKFLEVGLVVLARNHNYIFYFFDKTIIIYILKLDVWALFKIV